MAQRNHRPPRTRNESIASLISRLYDRVHVPLLEALPRICEAAAEMGDGPREAQLREELRQLWAQLDVHLRHGAHHVFPRILSGHGASMQTVLDGFCVDNDELMLAITRIARLTQDYRAPDDTQRALYDELRWLDERVRELATLENTVLYPRAIAGERPYAPEPAASGQAWAAE